MASGPNSIKQLDAIIDTISPSAVKAMIHQIIGFSCVPYKPHDHWCNNCYSCWKKYLQWISDDKNQNG